MILYKHFGIAQWLLLAACACLTTACQNSPPEKIPISRQPQYYIGFQYENEREIQDLEYLGGSIFGGGAVKNMEGGYSYMRQNQQNMLWLIGYKKPDPQGKEIREVLDVLTFPEYDQKLNDRTYHLNLGNCRINGKSTSDVEVVALVVLEKKEWLDNVKQAWRINRKTGKFEPAPTENMLCENPHLF